MAAIQVAKLASTAKTSKPIAGRRVKATVAKVGATPWGRAKVGRSVGRRTGSGRSKIL